MIQPVNRHLTIARTYACPQFGGHEEVSRCGMNPLRSVQVERGIGTGMRNRSRVSAAVLLASLLAVGATQAAHAGTASGYRHCSAGYTLTTSTTSGSGPVSHSHQNLNTGQSNSKTFHNTGVQTRYWGTFYQNAYFHLQSSGSLSAYGANCYN